MSKVNGIMRKTEDYFAQTALVGLVTEDYGINDRLFVR